MLCMDSNVTDVPLMEQNLWKCTIIIIIIIIQAYKSRKITKQWIYEPATIADDCSRALTVRNIFMEICSIVCVIRMVM